MKYAIAIATLFAALLAAPAARGQSRPDLIDTAVSAGSFQTLAAALQAAGLVDALRGPGPFTVFAPTDEAFARLPEGTVAALLEPENRAQLKAILTYHVVPGRVASTDLLGAASTKSLEGRPLAFGLTVGAANVVKADVQASNGVIHVIDAVLLPPKPEPAAPSHSASATEVIAAAVSRGAPAYNAGDHQGCADLYEASARMLLTSGSTLGELQRMRLEAIVESLPHDHSDRAWALRRAFDEIVADEAFEPRIEAPMPADFPAAGPVGQVIAKEYPAYRAARANGGNSFWTLFQHIKKNDVQMTAPVEMTVDASSLRATDMAFLYEATTQGSLGQQGQVSVQDLSPVTVLSIGMRGERTKEDLEMAKAAIERRLEADGWQPAGAWRLMGYNSPMVPSAKRFWELQIPVSR